MIWVEWDATNNRVVSFGWHYYYRWAYQDTVRRNGATQRPEVSPLPEEKGPVPAKLSAVRRLFGYTASKDDGTAEIGEKKYSQLMGRIAINAAIEINIRPEPERFLKATFLKELGMPRPSAVEFYLEQPYTAGHRPSDQAKLVTYGDARGYDQPGELNGRKFYLDRPDAYGEVKPWADNSSQSNGRATLAFEASREGACFRFTLRFRDLDPQELAAVLLALCPHQFGASVAGNHAEGYCSKLGYARPLGWGTVRIEAKHLFFLNGVTEGVPKLDAGPDVGAWLTSHFVRPPQLAVWLGVHRHKHPDAGDYQKSNVDGQIYTFHTELRAEHSRKRRYRPE